MENVIVENNTEKTSLPEYLEECFERVESFDTEKGGIYVETTEDPRGWMLGDNTRRIYKLPNLYFRTLIDIKMLTDLLVRAIPINDDGSEIRVSVCNPRDVARMLLSKNDDVGSFIQYAHIEPPKHAELVAKIGEHVCIESLSRGSWVRLHVFPGGDILEMMNTDESGILNVLKSCGNVNKETIVIFVDRYYEMEENINVLLSKMERHGNSCNCEEPLVFKQIFDGKFEEIVQTCLNCGGTVER